MLPEFAPVLQAVTTDRIGDIASHIREELRASGALQSIRPGMRVAIGVGSRGISGIREITVAVIESLQQLGAQPFLVPAMGSHGGGTAEGQRQVLVGFGLGSERTGVPILSDVDPVQIGMTGGGVPVFFDAPAAKSDAIVAINRIKPHTAFRNRWESGILKMLSVGFGKARGAAVIHGAGLRDTIPQVASVVLSVLPVVLGIGIVENGMHEPAIVRAIPAPCIEQEEAALLEQAWRHFPRIPLEPLDLLVLREIGKDISGTGMDVNVVGFWRRAGGPVCPAFRTLAALDLTDASRGNAIGVGYADIITQRLRDKINVADTYANCVAARNYSAAKIPMAVPTDRAAMEVTLPREAHEARIVLAANTRDLARLWVSEALVAEVRSTPGLTLTGRLAPLEFDSEGRLRLA